MKTRKLIIRYTKVAHPQILKGGDNLCQPCCHKVGHAQNV